ncbi:MAG: hypothetical protein BV457_03055 [Thermoplasmata archaeon M9B1D]|nr:MAG: hypothetical protein BV457_03055 [Thermoplasmata archaeon M9B1D]PNX51732.1 MAG: hypothetical protein BV456_02175 [Thermoplasmata archaeon M8B2D]
MKNKIIAIFVIMTLIAISFSAAQANEINKIEKNDKISIEIGTLTENGASEIETFLLSEGQILELETFFAAISQKMESATSWEEINCILDEIPDTPGTLMDIINKIIFKIKFMIHNILAKFKLYFNRGFIVSFGHNYKLNPFKKSDIKLMKNFAMWRYSDKALLKDRTVIFKMIKDPLGSQIKTLKGMQFGFMVNFIGLHIHIARKFPAHSTTFFLGIARYINGLQI